MKLSGPGDGVSVQRGTDWKRRRPFAAKQVVFAHVDDGRRPDTHAPFSDDGQCPTAWTVVPSYTRGGGFPSKANSTRSCNLVCGSDRVPCPMKVEPANGQASTLAAREASPCANGCQGPAIVDAGPRPSEEFKLVCGRYLAAPRVDLCVCTKYFVHRPAREFTAAQLRR